MEILENVTLGPYTTFRIGGPARYFIFAQTDEEVIEGAEYAVSQPLNLFVFGGGSNVLVHDNGFKGLAMRMETIGIDIVEDNSDAILLKVASGEVWDDVVRFAVEQEWYGIENLSHIPGFAGAFSVQNVGAYGQEAADVVEFVEAYDRESKSTVRLSNAECKFGYRSSIFNTEAQGRYIILHTYIRLNKRGVLNTSYGDVRKYFEDERPTIHQMRKAIITIRDTKFPFPDKPELGNAGSFFRGPILTELEFTGVCEAISSSFGIEAVQKLGAMKDRLRVPQGYKTPAAFLLDICGLKGYQIGGAKINEPQPAIILNTTGTATASDVTQLFGYAASKVKELTGVKLHFEPELVGFSATEKQALFDF